MAKVKFGMMMVDARGKLGGHVFSKNRGGSYVRTKVTPVNPQTSDQTSVRALFGSISQGWSGLTEDQRNSFRGAVEAWATTDIFGDLIKPSGKALYQRLNQQAQIAGYPAITSAPLPSEVPSATLDAAEIGIGAEYFNVDITGDPTGAKAIISATPPLSQGTKFVKDKLRQIVVTDFDPQDTAAQYTAYVSKFGTPSAGDNIYMSIKFVDANGNSTPGQTAKVLVVA